VVQKGNVEPCIIVLVFLGIETFLSEAIIDDIRQQRSYQKEYTEIKPGLLSQTPILSLTQTLSSRVVQTFVDF
jgi:hypothetical protein